MTPTMPGTAPPIWPMRPTWRAVEQIMGLPVSLVLRGRHANDGRGRAAWAAVVSDLIEVDRVFSTYRPDSDISRLDAGELTVDQCAPEVATVLALGEQARIESDGAFNVRRAGPDGRFVLDPSGVVKGWAVQRAAAHLAVLDDTDYCLSAGGDMVSHVDDPARPPWQIGIENPHDATRLVARIPLRRGAVATSGAAHRGEHVSDPRTGLAPCGIASVTVLANELTWADIDATAGFAHGRAALHWLRARPNRSGIVVWADGSVDTF